MKLQIPSSKLQGRSKLQAPGCAHELWSFKHGASMELGAWNLELLSSLESGTWNLPR